MIYTNTQLNILMPIDSKNVSKVIMLRGKQCLFLERVDGKGWELPGGHLNIGENFINGAKREVYEETSIKIKNLTPILKQRDFMLFATRPRNFNVKISNEHVGFGWFDYKQIKRLNVTKATKQNLRLILNVIKTIQ